MTDARLRELERRWRTGGDAVDEAAHLLERLRRGELTHDWLKLAAHCGSAGARAALGQAVASPPTTLQELVEWVWELAPFGKRALVAAAAAAAEACALVAEHGVPEDPDWQAYTGRAEVRGGLVAVEGWRRCPCDEHLAAAAEASCRLRPLERDIDFAVYELGGRGGRERHLWSVAAIGQAIDVVAWTPASVPAELDARERAARVEAGPAHEAATAVRLATMVLDDVGVMFGRLLVALAPPRVTPHQGKDGRPTMGPRRT